MTDIRNPQSTDGHGGEAHAAATVDRTEDTAPLDRPGPGASDDLGVEGTHRAPAARTDPVAAARSPENRAKIALATAVMSLLNLVLLVILLGTVMNDGAGEEVVVDDQPCVIHTVDGENFLYCRR